MPARRHRLGSPEGLTPAEAAAAQGGALERVLALIDNCEWRRLRRQESGEPVDILPDPDELRSRIGIVPAHPAARSRRAPTYFDLKNPGWSP